MRDSAKSDIIKLRRLGGLLQSIYGEDLIELESVMIELMIVKQFSEHSDGRQKLKKCLVALRDESSGKLKKAYSGLLGIGHDDRDKLIVEFFNIRASELEGNKLKGLL